MTARALLEAVADEMRSRKINHGKDTSPTLIAWADRIDEIASSLEGRADVTEGDRTRLLFGFMLDCNVIGAKEAGVNLARGIKDVVARTTKDKPA